MMSLDQNPVVPPAREANAEGSLGLALSGGGVRASLFSLGVVLGLIEAKQNSRLRCIASVSGGSIVNAALAHSDPLHEFKTVEEFRELASRLASSLASRGALAFGWRSMGTGLWYALRIIGRAFVPVAMLLAFGLDLLQEGVGFDVRNIPWSTVPWGTVALVTLLVVLVTGLLSRGLFQEARFRSVVAGAVGTGNIFSGFKRRLFVRDWGSGTERQGGPRIMHVLVATDLLSGQPMYFSSQFVYCLPYGWSPPLELRTEEALYSSAAFPAVFPPKKLKLKVLDFQDGEMAGPLPRAVRLADGGVYNNLGTDWFDVLEPRSDPMPTLLWPFGELKVEAPKIDKHHTIVVNASAPSRSVASLPPFPVARIMSVLYDNTVKPRVEAIREEKLPLIDIQESPADLAHRLVKELKGAAVQRAEMLVRKLEGRTDGFWKDFTTETSGTATKLSSAGRRSGARLLQHGYLSSLVLLHVCFNADLPDELRGERYFDRLVSGKHDDEEPSPEDAEPTT